MDNTDNRLKHVDNLSALFEFTVYTTQAMPQFRPALLTKFKGECSANSLQTNESKTKIVTFNPLKQDLVCSTPWFLLVSSATFLGVNLRVDCSFRAHFQWLFQKSNCFFHFNVPLACPSKSDENGISYIHTSHIKMYMPRSGASNS